MLPQEQCRNAFLALTHRWVEESDLEDEQILEAMNDAAVRFFEEPIVEFIADDGFLEEETEEEPSDDEGLDEG
jgi:hypothetical protein